MQQKSLSPSELKMLRVIWENEPLKSGVLVRICLEKFGWKKSTVYTILKNLLEKGYAVNGGGTVAAMFDEKDYYHKIAADTVNEYFGSSIGDFLAAYLNGNHMSRDEILECYEKVKKYRED